MDICEATRQAMEKKCCMARKAWSNSCRTRIEPTTSPDGCVIHSRTQRNLYCRWEPTAEDLMADDWVLLGYHDGSEFCDGV